MSSYTIMVMHSIVVRFHRTKEIRTELMFLSWGLEMCNK